MDTAGAEISGTRVRPGGQVAGQRISVDVCAAQRTGSRGLPDVTLRLVNTNNPSDRTEGILEASTDGATTWGPVCDDFFDSNNNAAEVVCRMMGFDAHGRSFSQICCW